MEQKKHKFDPLPSGIHLISEKEGERIAEWKSVTIIQTSKERRAKESVPTLEEANKIFATAKPKIVRPPNDKKEDVPFQTKLDPSRLIPGQFDSSGSLRTALLSRRQCEFGSPLNPPIWETSSQDSVSKSPRMGDLGGRSR